MVEQSRGEHFVIEQFCPLRWLLFGGDNEGGILGELVDKNKKNYGYSFFHGEEHGVIRYNEVRFSNRFIAATANNTLLVCKITFWIASFAIPNVCKLTVEK